MMEAVPTAMVKGGAEGIAAVAVPGVGAVAVKIDDGAMRAAVPVSVAALRTLDLSSVKVDNTALDALGTSPIVGAGRRVGEVRPVWPTA